MLLEFDCEGERQTLINMRSRNGSLSAEFVAGLVFIVFLGLALIDLTAVLLSYQYNDAVCMQICKLIGSGPPGQALARARLVVARAQSQRGWFCHSIALSKSPTVSLRAPSALVLEQTGGQVNGSATVATQVQVNAPIFGTLSGGNFPVLQSSHTYPFTYTYPAP